MTAKGPGQVLFGFVRHWSRRSSPGDYAAAEQGRLVLVTESVHALMERGIAATVNAVAHEIGIDQSGASRMIKSATEAGYLSMRASRTDARCREAALTSAGRSMLKQAHHWQEQVFDQLTVGWSDRRRDDFQRAMADLVDRSNALDV
ncbi:MAG: winged helix-turn-helix transcriptional regulator [Micromonosporaceae bacterium]|nr:winged helix-turn-helix transcriptional regulator [Micromonosporaceae bacterium]